MPARGFKKYTDDTVPRACRTCGIVKPGASFYPGAIYKPTGRRTPSTECKPCLTTRTGNERRARVARRKPTAEAVPTGSRVCSLCKVEKPLVEFHKAVGRKHDRTARCKPCQNSKSSAWRKDNKDRLRVESLEYYYARQRYAKYGITKSDFERIVAAQVSCCGICGIEGTPETLVIDHCHETNEVRGALCLSCNWGLGHFKDNASALRCAAEYLDKFRGGNS